MKKIVSAILLGVILLSFVACSNDKTEGSSQNPSTSNTITQNTSSETSSVFDTQKVMGEIKSKAKKIINEQVYGDMTDIEKAKQLYTWLYFNFKYRAIYVDISKGYTDELTAQLADYYFTYYKGSCEHYAAAQKIFLDLLGFETYYIEGERLDSGTGEWGEHVWLLVHYEGNYYHVDGLFGGNHAPSLYSTFFVPDSAIEKTHRWDKEYYPACTQPQLIV